MCRSFDASSKIALRAISRRMAQVVFEIAKEGNRVQRHLDARWRRKLRPHAAHTLAGGPFALVAFAFKNHHIAATGQGELISDARADNPAANDDDFRGRNQFNSLTRLTFIHDS